MIYRGYEIRVRRMGLLDWQWRVLNNGMSYTANWTTPTKRWAVRSAKKHIDQEIADKTIEWRKP